MDRREIKPACEIDEAQALRVLQRTMPAHIHIEAGLGLRDLDIERLSPRLQMLADGTCDRRRLILQAGFGDGAECDLDDLMAAWGHVAHMHGAVGKAHMKRDPTTSFAMGIHEWLDGRLDPRLAQGMRENLLLPRSIEAVRHVLRRATAACVEIGAERRLALRRGHIDAHKARMRSVAFDRHGLPRQHLRHEDGAGAALRDTVGFRAEALDRYLFSHGGLLTKTHDCRPHPRWEKGSGR